MGEGRFVRKSRMCCVAKAHERACWAASWVGAALSLQTPMRGFVFSCVHVNENAVAAPTSRRDGCQWLAALLWQGRSGCEAGNGRHNEGPEGLATQCPRRLNSSQIPVGVASPTGYITYNVLTIPLPLSFSLTLSLSLRVTPSPLSPPSSSH